MEDLIARIEALKAELRRDPMYQRELDWYRTYTVFDIEAILATVDGRKGFSAGLLYARCQAECGTNLRLLGEG